MIDEIKAMNKIVLNSFIILLDIKVGVKLIALSTKLVKSERPIV
tara:strand:- start:77885 stop:78016 length:132 start_codon:yes stop_codon:yes gene_type:complete